MILLDTHALLWLDRGSRRARPLSAWAGRIAVSPATLLELRFLEEAGRVSLRKGRDYADLASDPRWQVDDLPSAAWFEVAVGLGWTRDPFDRLLAAHARYRRWRLATADEELIRHLGPKGVVEL